MSTFPTETERLKNRMDSAQDSLDDALHEQRNFHLVMGVMWFLAAALTAVTVLLSIFVHIGWSAAVALVVLAPIIIWACVYLGHDAYAIAIKQKVRDADRAYNKACDAYIEKDKAA